MHTEANSEIRDLVFPGKLDCFDLALDTPFPKASGDQNPVACFQQYRPSILFKGLRVHPVNIDTDIIANPSMNQSFSKAFIGLLQVNIFAHNSDLDLAIRFF